MEILAGAEEEAALCSAWQKRNRVPCLREPAHSPLHEVGNSLGSELWCLKGPAGSMGASCGWPRHSPEWECSAGVEQLHHPAPHLPGTDLGLLHLEQVYIPFI